MTDISQPMRPVRPVEVPVARVQEIVRQLAALQRELFVLDFPVAGVRVAVVVEQLGRDLTDKLYAAGQRWCDEAEDAPGRSDAACRELAPMA